MPGNEFPSLNYFQWEDVFHTVKPYELLMDVPEGVPNTNFKTVPSPRQRVENIRGREADFDLDNNGFMVRQQPLNVTSVDIESIEGDYFQSLRDLVEKEIPDVLEIKFFDWRLRSSSEAKTVPEEDSMIDLSNPLEWMPPIEAVHVDQSPAAARKRALFHLGDRGTALLAGSRFRIINIWRPLADPIEDYPLALCDGSTVPSERLVVTDHVRRTYVGESLYPLWDGEYRWYYLKNQTNNEVLLFKTYDSSSNVKAKCCPHTSFKHAHIPMNAKPRESIEVRALVFSRN